MLLVKRQKVYRFKASIESDSNSPVIPQRKLAAGKIISVCPESPMMKRL